MAKDLNQCSFIGRLGKDIEIRYLQDGKAVASGTMAVNGYKEGQTEWVRFSAFDKLAEVMAKYLSKGSQLFLSGRMQTRSWEKDGETKYSTEIIANDVLFLGGKPERQEPERQESKYPAPPEHEFEQESDIPF